MFDRAPHLFDVYRAWACLSCILTFIVGISRLEKVVVLLLIIMILVLEILNTVVEHLVDMLKPRLHTYAQTIKDLMAAMGLALLQTEQSERCSSATTLRT